jgi:hypothetical protein
MHDATPIPTTPSALGLQAPEPDGERPARAWAVDGVSIDVTLLFVTALGLRLLWVALIPPWNAPDELSHFTYVAHIVEQGEIPHPPPYPAGQPQYSVELESSVAATLLTKFSHVGGPQEDSDFLPIRYNYGHVRGLVANGHDRWSEAASSATSYPPLYYLLGSLPYRSLYQSPILARMFGVRSVSALLGALSCIFVYLFAYELRRSRSLARTVGLVTALAPMHCFITASVNNDSAMVLAAAILCWLVVRIWTAPDLGWRTVAMAGAAAGFALMSKPTPLALVAALGFCIACRSVMLTGFTLRAYATHQHRLMLFAGTLVAVCAPWSIYQRIAQASAPVSDRAAPAQRFAYSLTEYLHTLDREHLDWLLLRSYWGHFGWLDLPLPHQAYSAIRPVYVLAAAGLGIALFFKPKLREGLLLGLALIGIHAFFLFVGVDYFSSYAETGQRFGLQGRYFFVVSAPISFLLVSGLTQLFRSKVLVLPAVCVAALWLQLVGIVTLLARYYGVTVT